MTFRYALAAILATGSVATAGTKTTIEYDQLTTTCGHRTELLDGDKDVFEVGVFEVDPKTRKAKVAAAKADVVFRVSDNKAQQLHTATIAAKTTKLATPFTATLVGGETIRVGGDKTKCSFVFTKDTQSNPGDPDELGTPKGDKDPLEGNALLNASALKFLGDREIRDHERSGDRRGHTFKVYHLPDGSPAFPLPGNIAEEDRVEVWIASVASTNVSLEITACKDVPAVRISGTRPGSKAEPVESGELPTWEFELRRISAPSKCAEQLSYKIVTQHGSKEITIKVAPVHRFAWGLAYGFDFGRPTQLKLVERPIEGGAGETERVIARDTRRSGFRPMVTLTLNACNANLEDWDLCDGFGLTAMADPSRLTQGGGLGLKIQPYPGLGVLLGLTFFKVDTFSAGHDLSVGDVFPGTGDLPIDEEFTWKSFGFFIGVGGDTDTVKKLF